MENITENKLLRILYKNKKKMVYIDFLGTIAGSTIIQKLIFLYFNNIIILKDINSKSYFTINISYVYKILASKDKKKIKVFLDEDVVVMIKFL